LLRLLQCPILSCWGETTGSHMTWKESPIFWQHGVKYQNHILHINGKWCKLWPDCILGSQEHNTTLAAVTENVKEIPEEIALDDIEVGDINELIESYILYCSILLH
jgi:hypothetical protein